jgi:hypothetical protein
VPKTPGKYGRKKARRSGLLGLWAQKSPPKWAFLLRD